MKRYAHEFILSSALCLTAAVTLGCGSELEPAPQLTDSVQAEIAAEDAEVESAEMQQMNQQ
ncbi:hypothetical protein [Candidatus Laterigemmans baculatus]|uniref:hypothetical protein n=1 Tax=Candidatus Laterigemmans baculatus TaxID=2770505 RepID=UPI0013DA5CE4|nr:hypothetical protein [Candidatus Laterigemmans baculatus]